MDGMLYSTVNTAISNRFFEKVFLVISTFCCFAIACHPPPSNAIKDIKKKSILNDLLDKIRRCDFKLFPDLLIVIQIKGTLKMKIHKRHSCTSIF